MTLKISAWCFPNSSFRTISGRHSWKTGKARSQAPESRSDLDGKWAIGFRSREQFIAGDWEFNIRGIYTGSRDNDDLTQFWFHYKYLDERRQYGKGLVGWYTVKLDTPDDGTRVTKAIDTMFANSPYETKTETEKALATSISRSSSAISAS